MDDNRNSFSAAVSLTFSGSSTLAAGQSILFGEDTGMTAATVNALFESAWFGTDVPSTFTVANYGGSSVGLSQSGDAVNIDHGLPHGGRAGLALPGIQQASHGSRLTPATAGYRRGDRGACFFASPQYGERSSLI